MKIINAFSSKVLNKTVPFPNNASQLYRIRLFPSVRKVNYLSQIHNKNVYLPSLIYYKTLILEVIYTISQRLKRVI